MSTPATTKVWREGKKTIRIKIESVATGSVPGSFDGLTALTNSDIAEGGFVWNRSCAMGEKVTFGSCIASELDLTLVNVNGKFDRFRFEGARVVPTITASLDYVDEDEADEEKKNKTAVENVICGVFWVDNVPTNGNRITLQCYDNMVKYDDVLTMTELATIFGDTTFNPESGLTTPTPKFNIATIAQNAAALGSYSLANASSLSDYGNAGTLVFEGRSYSSPQAFDPNANEVTRRDLLSWCSELLGGFMFCNSDGNIEFRPYVKNTVSASPIIPLEDVSSRSIQNLDVTVEGVRMSNNDVTVMSAITKTGTGQDYYTIDISDNPFWWWGETANADKKTQWLQMLSDNISKLFVKNNATIWKYRPMSIATFAIYPYIKVGDFVAVKATDKEGGGNIITLVTDITYDYNGGMSINSIGISNVADGWASKKLLTNRQKNAFATVFEKLKDMFKLQDESAVKEKVDAERDARDAAFGTLDTKIDGVEDSLGGDIVELGSKLEGEIESAKTSANAYAQSIADLNDKMAGMFGLYSTKLANSGGGYDYYWHNNTTLQASKVVYKLSSGGFAWTNDYKGDSTVWESGVTADGKAVLRELSAWTVTANDITTGILKSHKGESYFDLTNNKLVISSKDSSISLGTKSLHTELTPNKAQIGNPLQMQRAEGTTDETVATVLTLTRGISDSDPDKFSLGVGYDNKMTDVVIGSSGDSGALAHISRTNANFSVPVSAQGVTTSGNISATGGNITVNKNASNEGGNISASGTITAGGSITTGVNFNTGNGGNVILNPSSGTDYVYLKNDSGRLNIKDTTGRNYYPMMDFPIYVSTNVSSDVKLEGVVNTTTTWTLREWRSGLKEGWCKIKINGGWVCETGSGISLVDYNGISLNKKDASVLNPDYFTHYFTNAGGANAPVILDKNLNLLNQGTSILIASTNNWSGAESGYSLPKKNVLGKDTSIARGDPAYSAYMSPKRVFLYPPEVNDTKFFRNINSFSVSLSNGGTGGYGHRQVEADRIGTDYSKFILWNTRGGTFTGVEFMVEFKGT